MKKILSALGLALISTATVYSMEPVGENELRNFSGQEGIEMDLNYKATVGKVYFSDTVGNSLNFRNLSIDTDGSNDSGNDRPILLRTRNYDNGYNAGLLTEISNVNDIDLSIEQININGDSGSQGITSGEHSLGGISLLDINDNGGLTELYISSDSVFGREGIRLDTIFAENMSLKFEYVDRGSDYAVEDDDYKVKAGIRLNNFVSESLVGLISGTASDGVDIGGLNLKVISMSADIVVDNMSAGVQRGTMGRLVLNNFNVSPESYLTVQGK